MGLVIETLNLDLAFVVCHAWADLDLDHTFEGALVDRLCDLGARKTARDFSGVTDQFPDAL